MDGSGYRKVSSLPEPPHPQSKFGSLLEGGKKQTAYVQRSVRVR